MPLKAKNAKSQFQKAKVFSCVYDFKSDVLETILKNYPYYMVWLI